ncbi:MAG: hypothetical protein DMF99_02755 [Acidobacteria bacterium]|nr:MAG: hypothetical protein DMF99_02755 [Acidobacteriota bacterium]
MLDVGTKAPRNQKMPKAIGRVSLRRQAVTPSHSSAPTNTRPMTTRSSNGLANGDQSVSALRLTGRTNV